MVIMGFPNCPIFISIAFLKAFIKVTRIYMFYLLYKESEKRRALPLVPVYD